LAALDGDKEDDDEHAAMRVVGSRLIAEGLHDLRLLRMGLTKPA